MKKNKKRLGYLSLSRDVSVCGHVGGTTPYNDDVRGSFPSHSDLCVLRLGDLNLREVPRGFRNCTDLHVPKAVSSLLSYGPKFMLPCFTLCSEEYVEREWSKLLDELVRAEYLNIQYPSENVSLKKVFFKHTDNCNRLSRMQMRILCVANLADLFLKSHAKVALIVEGDKGKISGLMYRSEYVRLCNDYIESNVCKQYYQEVEMLDLEKFGEELKSVYKSRVSNLLRLYRSDDYMPKRLFYPAPGSDTTSRTLVSGYNAYVRSRLQRLSWGLPTLNPTVKFRKEVLKVRPVICKKGTPSIGLGFIIKYALEKICMNYPGFDPTLNVVTSELLLNDLFSVCDPKGEC
uniref:Uncharacterized protein n=1 Tax=Megaselia scalaris TaxID=36166 RepID=T1H5B5_MEGSC